jgi:alanine racemase
MDMTMIDVSAVKSVSVGDSAVLIGSQGNETITVQELADLQGAISYEIPCAISKRVPRIIV